MAARTHGALAASPNGQTPSDKDCKTPKLFFPSVMIFRWHRPFSTLNIMIVGIDLGTTNSLIAVWENGQARLIPNSLGDVLTPSCVSVDDDGSILVGRAARERLQTHPERSAAVFKRYMGSDKQIRLGGRSFRAEELSALVLRALKEDAEAALGQPVTKAIITVPAYFSDAQRKATRAAGQIA